MEALVTDTHDRAALAGLRGLGRAGIPTIALTPVRGGPGRWSRRATKREVGPDAIEDPRGFARKIQGIIDRDGERIIYPGREEAIEALLASKEHPRLAELLPYPSLEGLAAVRDKRGLPELAERVGLLAPRTLFEGTLGEFGEAAPELPLVVKPALAAGGTTRPSAVRTPAERNALIERSELQSLVVAQELHEGPLASIALVLDRDGSIAAQFHQRTIDTWPPEMGVSAVARSVQPDLALVERIAEMLRSVGYAGLAQVQILESAAGPVVIDVNPRFYGSLPLALAAGVNLPAIWHATLTGEPVQPPPDYRVGVIFRWYEARVFSLARRADAVSGSPRADVGAVWSRDDPLASAASILMTVRGSLSKRLRRAAAR
jgi:predicted ATP-grasp superfamily ATP-dependent carboligase